MVEAKNISCLPDPELEKQAAHLPTWTACQGSLCLEIWLKTNKKTWGGGGGGMINSYTSENQSHNEPETQQCWFWWVACVHTKLSTHSINRGMAIAIPAVCRRGMYTFTYVRYTNRSIHSIYRPDNSSCSGGCRKRMDIIMYQHTNRITRGLKTAVLMVLVDTDVIIIQNAYHLDQLSA